MKKTVLTMGLLAMSLMATDFSELTLQELIDMRGTVAVEDRTDFIAEMRSRVLAMTPEDLEAFRASRQGGRGLGGQGQAGLNQQTFADFDLDEDGQITEAELVTARAERVAQLQEEGRLTRNLDNAPTFSTIDTNSDDIIDETEFTAHQTAQRGNRMNNSSKQSMGRGQGRGKNVGRGQGMGRNR